MPNSFGFEVLGICSRGILWRVWLRRRTDTFIASVKLLSHAIFRTGHISGISYILRHLPYLSLSLSSIYSHTSSICGYDIKDIRQADLSVYAAFFLISLNVTAWLALFGKFGSYSSGVHRTRSMICFFGARSLLVSPGIHYNGKSGGVMIRKL